ncbi:hypothetical protein J1614_011004 [Plenodomus biglobosus]|nr:hypothetical protein J1614_011004 [Plenodomus biglobosus]
MPRDPRPEELIKEGKNCRPVLISNISLGTWHSDTTWDLELHGIQGGVYLRDDQLSDYYYAHSLLQLAPKAPTTYQSPWSRSRTLATVTHRIPRQFNTECTLVSASSVNVIEDGLEITPRISRIRAAKKCMR